jgi:hypothetical protein
MKTLIRYLTLHKRVKEKIKECESKIHKVYEEHELRAVHEATALEPNEYNEVQKYLYCIETLKELL